MQGYIQREQVKQQNKTLFETLLLLLRFIMYLTDPCLKNIGV